MKLEILSFCVLLSSVLGKKGFGPTDQEWGFVEVREKAHLFWWLHYTTSTDNPTTRPLVIWLQGGPGASSTGYGNFQEIGPLDTDLNVRNTSWVNYVNLMFVDNPVGAGYSYVEEGGSYATNNTQIANDFVVLLKEFYKELPKFKEVPLYIFSESYGGKMTAEIALVLYEHIQKGDIESNLQGIGLGDSWISPIDSTLTWAPYLLNLGFVDQNGYNVINDVANEARIAIENGNYKLATEKWGDTEGAVGRATIVDFYNVLTEFDAIDNYKARLQLYRPVLKDFEIDDLMDSVVREALNISSDISWGSQSGEVFLQLEEDFMKPVTEIVERLLNTTNVKIAVYNGQLDLIVDIIGTVKWVDELKWHGAEDWQSALRYAFAGNNFYEGFYKQVGNLTFYWVNRAGHMVPADNPAAMEYILRDITNNFSV